MRTSLDAHDYHYLDARQRAVIDEWLRGAGGDPADTARLTLVGEGVVIADVLRYDDDGKRVSGTRAVQLHPASPPPFIDW